MFLVGFFTVGLQPLLCPSNAGQLNLPLIGDNNRLSYNEGVKINGLVYNSTAFNETLIKAGYPAMSIDWVNQDISRSFSCPTCVGAVLNTTGFCDVPNQYINSPSFLADGVCLPPSLLQRLRPMARLTITWSGVDPKQNLIVVSGSVLNLTHFFATYKQWDISDSSVQTLKDKLGADVTLLLSREGSDVTKALRNRYSVAYIGTQSFGCSVYSTLNNVVLAVVIGLVLVRFVMAFRINV